MRLALTAAAVGLATLIAAPLSANAGGDLKDCGLARLFHHDRKAEAPAPAPKKVAAKPAPKKVAAKPMK